MLSMVPEDLDARIDSLFISEMAKVEGGVLKLAYEPYIPVLQAVEAKPEGFTVDYESDVSEEIIPCPEEEEPTDPEGEDGTEDDTSANDEEGTEEEEIEEPLC